jgi:hypothetical protein
MARPSFKAITLIEAIPKRETFIDDRMETIEDTLNKNCFKG